MRSMSRLFEVRKHELNGELNILVDLEKVCSVRLEKETGHHFPRLLVRLVDGHESRELVPAEAAQQFIEAYRTYLTGASSKPA
jgi:hypothetical protein